MTDNIYQHVDILEKNKKNAFSLGQSLWIDKEEFEDLEEIISRYVYPMGNYARELINYKYYKDTDGGKIEKAEAIIREEKKKNTNKIHYLFSASAVSQTFITFVRTVRDSVCPTEIKSFHVDRENICWLSCWNWKISLRNYVTIRNDDKQNNDRGNLSKLSSASFETSFLIMKC